MAGEVNQEQGSDLGFPNTGAPPLLPAYVRYDGNLYRRAQLASSDMVESSPKVFVVSALYGLLEAKEPIRNYNLSMSDTLRSKTKVKTWWRRRGLGELLSTVATNLGATRVHDLLSGHYRDAVGDYETALPLGCEYVPYAYPGLGSGSDFHRGSDLRKILDDTGGTALRACPEVAERPATQSETHMSNPSIAEVWKRLRAHEGEVFRLIRGKEFTYTVHDGFVEPSSTNWRFPRKQIGEAVGLMPVKNTRPLQHLYGPSYLYAILMDKRIRGVDW